MEGMLLSLPMLQKDACSKKQVLHKLVSLIFVITCSTTELTGRVSLKTIKNSKKQKSFLKTAGCFRGPGFFLFNKNKL